MLSRLSRELPSTSWASDSCPRAHGRRSTGPRYTLCCDSILLVLLDRSRPSIQIGRTEFDHLNMPPTPNSGDPSRSMTLFHQYIPPPKNTFPSICPWIHQESSRVCHTALNRGRFILHRGGRRYCHCYWGKYVGEILPLVVAAEIDDIYLSHRVQSICSQ